MWFCCISTDLFDSDLSVILLNYKLNSGIDFLGLFGTHTHSRSLTLVTVLLSVRTANTFHTLYIKSMNFPSLLTFLDPASHRQNSHSQHSVLQNKVAIINLLLLTAPSFLPHLSSSQRLNCWRVTWDNLHPHFRQSETLACSCLYWHCLNCLASGQISVASDCGIKALWSDVLVLPD